MTDTAMTTTTKIEQVKSLFDVTDKYLCPRQYDIQIRVETVQQFTEHLTVDRVLDIGDRTSAAFPPRVLRTGDQLCSRVRRPTPDSSSVRARMHLIAISGHRGLPGPQQTW